MKDLALISDTGSEESIPFPKVLAAVIEVTHPDYTGLCRIPCLPSILLLSSEAARVWGWLG